MKTRIRCGLVGIGRISAKHLAAFAHYAQDIELVAVCDTDPAAFNALPPDCRAQRFSDMKSMLAGVKLDMVTVCTVSGLHPEHGILAAQAGCHVIVEKPMATTWQAGLDLYNSCRKHNVKLFVVLQNRYNPPIVKLKEAIDAGRFGRIYMIVSSVFWMRPQSYYDQAAWRGTWKLDGGAFMNQASHYVDMLHYLGGPVQLVQASIATLARNIEVEDTGAALIRFASGALGSLNVTMLTYPQNREGSITILGEKGYVRIGGTAMNAIEAWEFADKGVADSEVTSANYTSDSVYGNGHTSFYQDVIRSIQNNTPPVLDGGEGLKSLELLIAIYDAARQQHAVTLPLPRP